MSADAHEPTPAGPFRWSMRVRFGHEDHAQVVYFPRYLDFFHQCFEDLFYERADGYRHCLEVDRVGWPAVHVETDFKSPLRHGDVFAVELTLEQLGTKSATLHYRGSRVDAAGETPVAEAKITIVCIEVGGADHFRPCAIPPRYRALFEGLRVTSHFG